MGHSGIRAKRIKKKCVGWEGWRGKTSGTHAFTSVVPGCAIRKRAFVCQNNHPHLTIHILHVIRLMYYVHVYRKRKEIARPPVPLQQKYAATLLGTGAYRLGLLKDTCNRYTGIELIERYY